MTTRPAAFLGVGRRAVAAHSRRHEDGITLAIFALALVVLLGMVALGIDGSRIYDERRRAQNAADHAAIAAAYESCTTTAADVFIAAETAGLASAEANGFDDNGVSNEVDINVTGGTGSHQYEAIVETTIATTFGAVLGRAELDTTARAEAEATGCDATGSSVPAIFGGGTSCTGSHQNVYIDGNDHVVIGASHSNGQWNTNGSDSSFTNAAGPAVTYRTTPVELKLGNGNTYSLPAQQDTTAHPWPAGFAPTDMTVAMFNAYKTSPQRVPQPGGDNADKFFINADGIYYTEFSGTVSIESITSGAEFVIVSRNGQIDMSKEHTGVYHAFPGNPAGTPANALVVAGYSNPNPCDQMAYKRGGNFGTWNGVFWAPRATLEWSGNEGNVVGGLIGWAVKLNGNEHHITGGTGASVADPFVFLLQ